MLQHSNRSWNEIKLVIQNRGCSYENHIGKLTKRNIKSTSNSNEAMLIMEWKTTLIWWTPFVFEETHHSVEFSTFNFLSSHFNGWIMYLIKKKTEKPNRIMNFMTKHFYSSVVISTFFILDFFEFILSLIFFRVSWT